MIKIKYNIENYWFSTKTPLYSLIFTLPLFFIYELGIIFTSKNELMSLRNGADSIMRETLEIFGIFGFYGIGAIFLLSIIVVFAFHKKYLHEIKFKIDYLFLMMVESFFWSILLYVFMSFILKNSHLLILGTRSKLLIQQVILSVGAGIYEELVFRVFLITIISIIVGFIFQWSSFLSNWLAIFISAGLFSSFHFIGEFGDWFSFNVFMIRFFAGIVLGSLYFIRGFGITAWTHSIYDLIVLTNNTTQ